MNQLNSQKTKYNPQTNRIDEIIKIIKGNQHKIESAVKGNLQINFAGNSVSATLTEKLSDV